MFAGGRQFQELVTDATGTLQLTMKLNATVVVPGSKMTIAVQAVSPSSAAESPRLTLDANSPVQLANPAPPDQINQTALAIQLALAIQFQNSLSFPVSPTFALPIGTLTVQQLDVVATGRALVAGVKAVTGGAGDHLPSWPTYYPTARRTSSCRCETLFPMFCSSRR